MDLFFRQPLKLRALPWRGRRRPLELSSAAAQVQPAGLDSRGAGLRGTGLPARGAGLPRTMLSRTMVEPVEVCSETTIGPAHSGDVGWPQAASNPMPPFAGNGDSRDASEAKAKAYRLPSPTSVVTHEMQSPFCLVPGALVTALRPHVCLIPVQARGPGD
jgi:hypothetical protein